MVVFFWGGRPGKCIRIKVKIIRIRVMIKVRVWG